MNQNEKLFIALLRQDLVAFVEQCFITLHAEAYHDNWHIHALCHQLIKAYQGEAPRLIFNLPPRSLKSHVISVAFPAWLLGHNPHKKIISVSYGDDLAKAHMRDFKIILESEWYQTAFPETRISPLKNTESEIITTKNGGRRATSMGSALTGLGADVIIIDDPLKADQANSEAYRTGANEWFDTTLYTRLNDKNKSLCIVVMQRLHENDLTGHLLEKGEFSLLAIPAIAEEKQIFPISDIALHERKANEVLHEQRENLETLQKIKKSIGTLNFSAQYQQMPVPAEGALFRREWLRFHTNKLPEGGITFWSWDPATTTSENSDFSVGTCWYIHTTGYFLLDLIKGRFDFNQLRQQVITAAKRKTCSTVLIEKAGNGMPLIQSLSGAALNIIPIPTKEDKETRAMRHVAIFEAGRVFFPKDAPWLADFLKELLAFPQARYDDQVDSLTQALIWAEHRLGFSRPKLHLKVYSVG